MLFINVSIRLQYIIVVFCSTNGQIAESISLDWKENVYESYSMEKVDHIKVLYK